MAEGFRQMARLDAFLESIHALAAKGKQPEGDQNYYELTQQTSVAASG